MQMPRTETAVHYTVAPTGPAIEAYTIPDFCRAYGVGRSYTYEEIKAGRLRIVKAGRRTLIPAADARAWLATLGADAA